eukprot:4848074-Pleurochrysis_carterae.AAC.1
MLLVRPNTNAGLGLQVHASEDPARMTYPRNVATIRRCVEQNDTMSDRSATKRVRTETAKKSSAAYLRQSENVLECLEREAGPDGDAVGRLEQRLRDTARESSAKNDALRCRKRTRSIGRSAVLDHAGLCGDGDAYPTCTHTPI